MHYSRKYGFLQELIILILFLFLINNYFGNNRPVILADGKGYYEYLPAIFIYKDLNFQYTDTLVSDFYDHKVSSNGYLPLIKGKKVNKYFVGTALAQSPFFLVAHWIANTNPELKTDGYSLIYQDFIFYAALLYLFTGLFFLRKLLQLQKIPLPGIFAIQLAVLFASSLMYYVVRLPSFSHVYSFAFVNIFLFLMAKYSITAQSRLIYLASATLGIILLIRPVNGLIIFFIPFLFPDSGSFKSALIILLKKQKKATIISFFIFLLIILIQPLVWYHQTGAFFIKSYQDEGLILTQPNVVKFLFSYQKGFFVYAPVFLFLLTMGTIHYLQNKNIWKLLSFYFPFLLTVYVLSSWWVWYYGSSFGSRVMIDYYGIMALFGSTVFILKRKLIKIITIILFGCFVFLAIIQTYQYDHFIMHWDGMSKERYWKIFLKTEDKYKGLFYHNTLYSKKENIIYSNTHSKLQSLHLDTPKTILIDSIRIESQQNLSKPIGIKFNYTVSCFECTDKLVVTIDEINGKNKYYTSKYLFYGTQKENYSGIATINLKLQEFNLSSDYLKVYLIKQEMTSEIDSYNIELFYID